MRLLARAVAVLIAMLTGVALISCGGRPGSGPSRSSAGSTAVDGLTTAQLAEARRLLAPGNPPVPPTRAQVECVARVVVLNPDIDQIANDMAQVQNKDLRQLVMTSYLGCAYDFVLDYYMRFAPSGLSSPVKACIRSKFTQLSVSRLSEVIVDDPDAGYTGPLTIHLCETGSKSNPLLHGTLPSMSGS